MPEPLNILGLDPYDPNDFVIPLTLKVSDIQDLGGRQGTTSKTIKIPSSKKNDSLLSFYNEYNAEGTFNPNTATSSVIRRDNNIIAYGNTQVFLARWMGSQVSEYELRFFSENSEWISKLDDDSLRDLDLGNIRFGIAQATASWTNRGDQDNFVFAPVDYGGFDVKTSTTNIVLEEIRPHFFVLAILRKIFEGKGFNIQSEFFNKKEFRDLVLMWTIGEPEIDEDVLEVERSIADTDVEQTIMISSTPAGTVAVADLDTIIKDDSGNFDLATDKYTVPLTGTYEMTFDVDLTYSGGVPSSTKLTYIGYFLNGTTAGFFNQVGNRQFNGSTPDSDNRTITFTRYFEAGDEVYLGYRVGSNSGAGIVKATSAEFNIVPIKLELTDGLVLKTASLLPDIKQKDFVKAIFQMFNLVSTTNNRIGLVQIETRDNFYKDFTEAEDWTDKVDYSQDYTFERVQKGLKKIINFKYKEDSDDTLLEEFFDDYFVRYADSTEVLDNEFLSGEDDLIGLPFAPTVNGYTVDGGLYLPRLINEDNTPQYKWQPRIGYYNGLQNGDWTFESTAYTTYPQIIFTPEGDGVGNISLHFNNLKDVSTIKTNDLGLKDRFYEKTIQTINYGRLAKIYLRLDETDISAIDFRKLKFINLNGERIYFQLNAINDYLVGSDESVECEFLPEKVPNTFAYDG